jgi:hypothetical protein
MFGRPSSVFDFPDVPPGATAAISFDAIGETGLYELTWDTNAPEGFANFGIFTLSAEWWTGDPLNGGTFQATAPDAISSYSAVVSAVSTPEPRTTAGLVPFLIAGLFRLRRAAFSSPKASLFCQSPSHRRSS